MTFFPLEEFYPMTQSEIQDAVANDVTGYIERAAETVVKETVSPTRGNTSFTYYRTDARDYTEDWTSTVSTAKACGITMKMVTPKCQSKICLSGTLIIRAIVIAIAQISFLRQ